MSGFTISGGITLSTGLYLEGDAATPADQVQFTTAGTYEWIVPPGVYNVSVVCVGAGAGAGGSTVQITLGQDEQSFAGSGGGGGALSYTNNIPTMPGTVATIIVGARGIGGNNGSRGTFANGAPRTEVVSTSGTSGQDSSFSIDGTMYVLAKGGLNGFRNAYGTPTIGGFGGNAQQGIGTVRFSGGTGGSGINGSIRSGSVYEVPGHPGGGGSAGYITNGGDGGNGINTVSPNFGQNGGGGGGASGTNLSSPGGGGGGVGLLGGNASGTGGTSASQSGSGVSGGSAGSSTNGGGFGGGGAASRFGGKGGDGAVGGVRIIWGDNRAFPNTNTGNV